MLSINVIVLIFILASIALGYIFKINIGVISIVFSYLACNAAGISDKGVVSLWPLDLFFILLSVTFFYGFPLANGTLSLIAEKIVYKTQSRPWAIPIVLYFCVVIFSGVGPGHYAAFAFISPLVMIISSQIKMHKMLAAIIVYSGACAGGFNPFTLGGRVTHALITNAGYTPEMAMRYTMAVSRNTFIAHTIVFFLAYLIFKGYKIRPSENMLPPERLAKKQKMTLLLVCIVFILVIVPAVLLAIDPANSYIKMSVKFLDPAFLSFVGIVLCLLFKAGNERDAMKNIPWDIIMMICGLGMLIELAINLGTMDILSGWINTLNADKDSHFIVYVVGIISSIMALFSSTMGAVMPTIYPIIPKVNSTHTELLFSVVTVFATFTGYSPFSTGGALVLAGVSEDKERKKLFVQLMFLPITTIILAIILVTCGVIY
ncbi:SLC13 family permease [Serratia entomophila]|uniref:SLC13 family permease n=1 Tax=Serratia entomophila TaxID=42906 RepID=UPI00217A536F|nr:SLC13 family permease [Serratia entomophila]CAI0875507.1 Dicarboxylate carrier protein MatC N-terminus [Serratia entomophila]CAI1511248.1 Dicarboxylate carrier protein MatC N-terminus [Serratia entomophila]CAI1594701.1 Dicarboxylate carrier protein MatC N-terminus [Serratia entomophila]CAI1826196.1 Dicarboxylate carrier protein MatC N-terminus [Serratia entomophila]CAI1888230.1 Dicarboxylate carrier protein MatC N-terminus [Serratia entomophila]